MISHIEDSGKGSSVLVQFHNMFYLVNRYFDRGIMYDWVCLCGFGIEVSIVVKSMSNLSSSILIGICRNKSSKF